MPNRMGVPALRALLTALLMFGGEILLWYLPTERPLRDWLPLTIGYAALASLLLDLLSRWRPRDLFAMLSLGGVFGLLSGVLLNPAISLQNPDITLAARVLGGQSWVGVLMLGLWLALLRGKPVWLVPLGAAVIGLSWGIWSRGFPVVLTSGAVGEPALTTMLLFAVGALVIIAALWLWAARTAAHITPDALKLGRNGWPAVVIIFGGLLLWQYSEGVLPGATLAVCVLLLTYTFITLWFQRTQTVPALISGSLPLSPPRPLAWIPALALFFICAVAGYAIPSDLGFVETVALVGGLFSAYGLVWLPLVSLWMGYRAIVRQLHAQQI